VSSTAKGNAVEKRGGNMLEARARQPQIGKNGLILTQGRPDYYQCNLMI
jgi:hypothetical protein